MPGSGMAGIETLEPKVKASPVAPSSPVRSVPAGIDVYEFRFWIDHARAEVAGIEAVQAG